MKTSFCIALLLFFTAQTGWGQDIADLRAKLLAETPIECNDKLPLADRTVPANLIVEAVNAGKKIDVTGAYISGVLGPDHTVLAKRFALRSCTFEEKVDFSHSNFQEESNFANSIFPKGADFTDTQFASEAYFNDTKFLGSEATFTRANFIHAAFFNNATFATIPNFTLSEFGQLANFNDAKFTGGYAITFNSVKASGLLCFDRAEFSGVVNFPSARIGESLSMRSTVFEKDASFNSISVGNAAIFSADPTTKRSTMFHGKVDFTKAKIGDNFEMDGTIFDGKADFNSMTIGGTAHFNPDQVTQSSTKFGSEANFSRAEINGDFNMNGAVFEGEGHFDKISIKGTADFSEGYNSLAQFKDAVSFSGAKIGGDLNMSGVSFDGPAKFNSISVGGIAFFMAAKILNTTKDTRQTRVIFHKEADFSGASISQQLQMPSVVFKGPVSFSSISVGAEAFFSRDPKIAFPDADTSNADFEEPVNFNVAKFNGPAMFAGVLFHKQVSFFGANWRAPVSFENVKFTEAIFDQANFASTADFSQTTVRSTMSLYYAHCPVLKLTNEPTALPSLNLQGCVYEHIDGEIGALLQALGKTNPDRLTLRHLETTLRQMGRDEDADKVHVYWQDGERTNDWNAGNKGGWLYYSIYKLLANYGTKPIRLLWWSLLILILGTAFFLRQKAFAPKEHNQHNHSSSALKFWPLSLRACSMSLYYFSPIDMPWGGKWRTNGFLSNFAAGFLKCSGFVLIPLGIAAITGLLTVSG